MSEVLELSLFKAFLKHPYEFGLYNLSKKFLLTTDDGTKGNKVFERFKVFKSKYDFYFWVNGVDIEVSDSPHTLNNASTPYLFFPARFDRWKRQDMAIEILTTLKKRDIDIRLLLCGHYFDQSYVKELEELVERNDLGELVSMQESMPKRQLYQYMQEATAMLFCYDFSNFGNVFIESSSLGALNVVRNDGSCDRVMSHGETGIVFDTVEQAADGIQSVLEGRIDSQLLKQNCKIKASEVFSGWEKRVSDEVELISTYSRCKLENN
jgi:glycosyltransferase involved in cell wall biosynthesis